jgi:hypothetical protein
MPYSDPATRKDFQKAWQRKAISDGYGKRLYARRKLHREHKLLFQQALFEVMNCTNVHEAHRVASAAIEQSRQEEEALEGWTRGVADDPRG